MATKPKGMGTNPLRLILMIVDDLSNLKKINMNSTEIHNKAIRLVEGGIVDINGLSVALRHAPVIFDPCFECEMDCLCHQGNDICNVCEECDSITREDCFLVLMGIK